MIKGQGQVVGVVGESGLGKSRLVAEFRWIDATSEAWLAALAERLAGMRILLLVTFRNG